MGNAEAELEVHIMEVGNKIVAAASSSVDELLPLLDQAETFLSRVEQSPPQEILTALNPVMSGLTAKGILGHSNTDVKVAVASCISEITRITAPEAPYDDDLMKEVFEMIVEAFRKLDDMSSRSYLKRVSILETVAKVRSCVVMLDLECNSLVLEMFHHFLNTIRDNHPENVFSSMEMIMTLVLDESEEISSDLLSCLLMNVKRNSKDTLPIARRLAEKVIGNCSLKLEPYLKEAVQSMGAAFADYSEVVASLCQGSPDVLEQNGENVSGECLTSRTPLNAITYDESLVGVKIKVWWPKDAQFYPGVVDSYDHATMRHKILYADGDEEVLLLKDEVFELLKCEKKEEEENDPPESAEMPRKKAKNSDSSVQKAKVVSSLKSGGSAGKGTVGKTKSGRKRGVDAAESAGDRRSGSSKMNDGTKAGSISKEKKRRRSNGDTPKGNILLKDEPNSKSKGVSPGAANKTKDNVTKIGRKYRSHTPGTGSRGRDAASKIGNAKNQSLLPGSKSKDTVHGSGSKLKPNIVGPGRRQRNSVINGSTKVKNISKKQLETPDFAIKVNSNARVSQKSEERRGKKRKKAES